MAKLQDIELQDFLDAFEQRMGGSFGGGSSSSGKNKNTAKGKNTSKSGGVLENFTKTINNLSFATRSLLNVTKNLLAPWAKVDQAAADFSKNIGLSAKGMDQLRKSAIKLVSEAKLGSLFDVSAEELIKMQENYAKAIGRNVSVGKEGLKNLAATSKVLGKEGATELMAKMENFGISMQDAGDRVGKMFASSSKKGLVWEKTSKNFLDNIKLAQNYTFKNGLKGLASMAEKATAIRLDMNQAASFADKVNTVEGAITTGASLQVLGGPFAQLSNPLQMMYEGLNDMEGLQDRIEKMFGSLGRFNKLTGEVEIGSFDKMRIREAAKATGMDYSNIMESIQAKARQQEIEKQLEANPYNLSKETRELIKNIGSIQEGQAGVVDKEGKFINAKNIDETKARELEQLYASESDDIKDIAAILRGWEESISGVSKQKDALLAQGAEVSSIGKISKNIIQGIGKSNLLLGVIAGAQVVGTVTGGLRGVGGFGGGTRRGGLRASEMRFAIKHGGIKVGKNLVAQNGELWHVAANGKLNQITPQQAARFGIGRKTVARSLSKIGATVAKGANIAGWVGLGGEILTDSLINNGKMKKGGFGDYAGHIGSQALGYGALGASIGSVIPFIGTAVGAAIGTVTGAITGAVKATKNKRERELSEHGVNLTGRYKNKELKEIQDAINGNGQISEKLQMKLEEQGDTAAVERLREIKNNIFKVQVVDADKYGVGGIVKGPGSATSDNIPALLSNGESVMTAKATKMFGPTLSVMNKIGGGTDDFGSIKPNVRGLNAGMIDVKAPSPSIHTISPSMGGTVGGTINVNFSPIKIEFPNGINKDVTNDLLSNPVFMRDLTKKIEEGLLRSGNGGHLVVRQGNKYI